MALDALHPALHPRLNQVTLNEIRSNGQIKQARFLYMTRGRKSETKTTLVFNSETKYEIDNHIRR